MHGDDRIDQVLTNLLENAVKYSPNGGRVTIAARRKSDTVEFQVADEGVGIPEGEHERIARTRRGIRRTVSGKRKATRTTAADGRYSFGPKFKRNHHVRVRLEGFERDSTLAVPRRAVQQSLGRQFVLVVGKGDTVATRDVQPGQWSGNLWIIDKGLAPGDRVIVDGVQKAAPGQPVRAVALADSAAGTTGTASQTATAGAARQ
mgnify:CR=1 FL=1